MTDQLWQCGKPIETAPKDRLIRVWAPARDGLKAMFSLCQWHPDAGFCIDELRVPEIWWELEDESWIHWQPLPPPPTKYEPKGAPFDEPMEVKHG